MYEFFLALFVFFTVFIDTLSILLKGTGTNKELAKVYVVSQALTYITRFSLFFILPVIGLILDKVIAFNVDYFILYLASFIFFHGVFYFFKTNVAVLNSPNFIELFNKSILDFANFGLIHLFTKIDEKNKVNTRIIVKFSDVKFFYGISHFFLALIFPFVLIIGEYFPHYRGVLMGSTSVYTGVFSIYITFFIERKIPYLDEKDRFKYVSLLISTKIMSSILFFLCMLSLLFVKYFI